MELAAAAPASPILANPSPRRDLLGLLLVVLALVPLVIWPQDVSWCIDEPRLIATAWHANNDGQLAAHGLYGNFGVCYGPVPTQIYQLLLSITHDPGVLIALRALLTASITAGSLLWLSRTLQLPSWFAAALIITPQIANYHRVLWDASFTIPFGTLAFAAFASFIKTQRPWPLRIALAAAIEIPLIHPQALPVAVPILGYLIWQHRADLWRDRRAILWTLCFLLVLNAKYLVIATFNVFYRLTHGSSTYPGTGSRFVSALAPFFGGNLLNGYDYVHTMARPAGPDWLVACASWCARLIYPLIWIGIGSGCWRFRSALRGIKNRSATPMDVVTFVAIVGLALQSLIFIAGRIPLGPQYYFGTFALHAFFGWLGLDLLRRIKLVVPVGAAFGLSCAYITLGIGYSMHHEGYNAGGWPTMRNAVELTKALNDYSDTVAYTDIERFKTYPQPLRTARLLIPPAPGQVQKHSGQLLLTYAERDGVRTGRMIVKDLGAAAPPKDSVSINITPLPRDWVPDPATW